MRPAEAPQRCTRHICDLMVTAGSADGIILGGVAHEMEQYLGTPGSSGVGSVLTTRRRFCWSPDPDLHQSALDPRLRAAYRRLTEELDVKAGTGLACRPAVLLV